MTPFKLCGRFLLTAIRRFRGCSTFVHWSASPTSWPILPAVWGLTVGWGAPGNCKSHDVGDRRLRRGAPTADFTGSGKSFIIIIIIIIIIIAKMPVEKGKFWARFSSQRGWGDSASWQATNSRQLGQWNWKNGRHGFEIALRDFPEFFVRWSEDAWSLIRAERSWKVRGKCTVKVTVGKSCDLVFAAEFHRQPTEFIQQWPVLYGLAFVFFLLLFFFRTSRAALFRTLCSRPIFVPQANRLRQSCSN